MKKIILYILFIVVFSVLVFAVDSDEDGIDDDVDNCLNLYNPEQINSDGDYPGDLCDNCIEAYNPDQSDSDVVCTFACNPMPDNVGDECDNCPDDFNPLQEDVNGDGVGNACEVDSDPPSITVELIPADPSPSDTVEFLVSVTDHDGILSIGINVNGANVLTCDQSPCIYFGGPYLDGFYYGVDIADQAGNVYQTDPNVHATLTDTDGDGVYDIMDNCDLVKNPGQEDVDVDGVGDVCDNCPPSYDSLACSGLSYSFNCVVCSFVSGVFCEYCCPYITSNPNQEDANDDGIGDICGDCEDGGIAIDEQGIDCGYSCPIDDCCANVYQDSNLGETGVDCGGSCPDCVSCAVCNDYVQPVRLRGDHNSGAIDVVFIPHWDYRLYGHMDEFIETVKGHIRNGYLMLDDWSDPLIANPITKDVEDIFNFYIYYNPDDPSAYGYKLHCSGGLPPNFWQIAPFTDSAGILARDHSFGCAGGKGTPSKWIASGWDRDVIIHESAHSIFALVDEYCGTTTYGQSSPISNVWSSLAGCDQAAAANSWNMGSCRQITNPPNCAVNWWRYDPDVTGLQDIMTCNCDDIPTFWEADSARVNYVINNWPTMDTLGVLMELNINDGVFTLLNSEVVDYHPDLGMQQPLFLADILSSENLSVFSFGLWDPRIELGDEVVYNHNVNFTIIIPFFDNLRWFNINNLTTNETIFNVDLSTTLEDYCEGIEYGAEECVTLDLDNDSVSDADDNCPNHYNPGQADSDGDGIGDPCDDHDGDGVINFDDRCQGTVIPESVPTNKLQINRHALVDEDNIFDTNLPKGRGPEVIYSTADTYGCSCEQILDTMDIGRKEKSGLYKFGCTQSVIGVWIG